MDRKIEHLKKTSKSFCLPIPIIVLKQLTSYIAN